MPPVNLDVKMPVEFTLTEKAKAALGLTTPDAVQAYIASAQRNMVGQELRREGDSLVGRFNVMVHGGEEQRGQIGGWVEHNKDKKATFSEIKLTLTPDMAADVHDPRRLGAILSVIGLSAIAHLVAPAPHSALSSEPPQITPRT